MRLVKCFHLGGGPAQLLALLVAVVHSVAFAPMRDAKAEQPATTVEAPASPAAIGEASAQKPTPTAGLPTADRAGSAIDALARGPFVVISSKDGRVIASRLKPPAEPVRMTEAEVVAAISAHSLLPADLTGLWETITDGSYVGLATLPIVKALATKTNTPQARDAMWGGLNGNAKWLDGRSKGTARGLLGLFEEHRAVLLAALPPVLESEGAGDDMVDLMQTTRVFGGDVWDSLPVLIARHPAALARRIERDRERGRPVKWEFQAFEGMIRWKDNHLTASAKHPPASLEALDMLSETYVTMFNSLHGLDEWYRSQMLRGLGAAEVFNSAVGGERELYRLGTSSYREFLHPTILKGIKAAGSLEAFLAQATPTRFGALPAGTASRRGLVFLRIAASFGLLDSVLASMKDKDRFIAEALDALGDPRAFETSSTLVVDVLTGRSESPTSVGFRKSLLTSLYDRYSVASTPLRRSVYGGMLSAYQIISGDRRDASVDRDFPIERHDQGLAFERLFRPDAARGHIHRIFMRLDEDLDAQRTFATLSPLLSQFGATVQQHPTFVVYRMVRDRRTVEMFVNKPTAAGVRLGMGEIARALGGASVESIIGRGHTGIITPLQKDSRRVLGPRITEVATVFVGACGSDASVRDMIGTFGTVPFITTKSTGRMVINNAYVAAYLEALLMLKPKTSLSLQDVLGSALSRFQSSKSPSDLREDAHLYRVNVATGLAMRLFDAYVRSHMEAGGSVPIAARSNERREPIVDAGPAPVIDANPPPAEPVAGARLSGSAGTAAPAATRVVARRAVPSRGGTEAVATPVPVLSAPGIDR